MSGYPGSGSGDGGYSVGWRDNIAPFSSAKGRGTSEPTWANVGNGHYAYRFAVGDELFMDFHVDHDYEVGSNVYPHVHFIVDDTMTAGQQVTWNIGYVVAKGHQQGESLTAAETVIQLTYTATGSEIAGEHIIVECSDVQAFEVFEADTLVSVRVELAAENVAGNVFGIMCDLHYLSNMPTTPNKQPPFN